MCDHLHDDIFLFLLTIDGRVCAIVCERSFCTRSSYSCQMHNQLEYQAAGDKQNYRKLSTEKLKSFVLNFEWEKQRIIAQTFSKWAIRRAKEKERRKKNFHNFSEFHFTCFLANIFGISKHTKKKNNKITKIGFCFNLHFSSIDFDEWLLFLTQFNCFLRLVFSRFDFCWFEISDFFRLFFLLFFSSVSSCFCWWIDQSIWMKTSSKPDNVIQNVTFLSLTPFDRSSFISSHFVLGVTSHDSLQTIETQ